MNVPQVLHLERRRRRARNLAKRAVRLAPPAVLLAAGVVLWQTLTTIRQVPEYLLPGPVAIWHATVDERDLLLTNAVPTLKIAVYGFLLALMLGFVLATAIHYSRVLELALYPILIASQSVPLIALAPILVVLLGFTIFPKLIIVCLICFFPIVVNAVDGFKSVDPDLVNLMRTLGAGKIRLFRDVEFPSALPYLFSGAKVAATFAVVGAIFGEWVGSWEGLGYIMIQKQAQFDTPALFSAMAILTAIGIGLFTLVAIAERVFMPWYRPEQERDAVGHGRR